jgi:hypothetical protein
MATSPKSRILMLLVATLFTLMAFTLPDSTRACPVGDVYQCYYPNGVSCIEYDCRAYSCSGTGTPTCYYIRSECCR